LDNKGLKNILAIDIGSTKVCAIIAEAVESDVRIIGAGVDKSQGLKRGAITNIELASRSIKNALNDAKRVAGTSNNSAIVSISGAYTKSIDSSGIVNIPNREIGLKEIERVMQTALYNANIPNDYDILHALPYNFKVDQQDFVEDPLGMNASRLEVQTHIIITQRSNFNNLKRAVELAGVKVENIVLNSYASSISITNYDEKSLGVAVIDLGGNTSNFVIHAGGNSIRYNGFLGVGSSHITNDLSMALHTPINVAENVKITYGNLKYQSDDLIELPVIGDEYSTHEVSLEIVHQVIYARVAETLELIAKQIESSGLRKDIGAGLILTGGLTKLEGIRELAVQIFGNLPVRLAKPKNMSGLFDSLRDPSYSTTIGLVMYSAGNFSLYEFDSNRVMRHNNQVPEPSKDVDVSDIANPGNGFSIKPQSTPPKPKPAENSIPELKRESPSIPKQTEYTIKSEPMNQQQPIESEIYSGGGYNGNRGGYDNRDPYRSQNSQNGGDNNSLAGKTWQWITQLF
jgi:cell division protein FtsA